MLARFGGSVPVGGVRLLPWRFMVIEQALRRHGIEGAVVAPALAR